jgi:hypothetical protein
MSDALVFEESDDDSTPFGSDGENGPPPFIAPSPAFAPMPRGGSFEDDAAMMTAGPPSPIPDEEGASLLAGSSVAQSAETHAWYNFLRPSALGAFFQVSELDVGTRLLKILVPFLQTGPLKGTFLRMTAANPDLYGPFWVTSTLVFALGVAANTFSYLTHSSSIVASAAEAASATAGASATSLAQKYDGDVAQLTVAAGICYVFLLLLPLAIWVESMVFGLVYVDSATQTTRTLSLANFMCLTGYSMLIYIPFCLVCVIPGVVTAIPLFIAATHAVAVTALELWPLLRRKSETESRYAPAAQRIPLRTESGGVAAIASVTLDSDDDEELGGDDGTGDDAIEATTLAGDGAGGDGGGAATGAKRALARLRSMSSIPHIAWTIGTLALAHGAFALVLKVVFFGFPWEHLRR